MKKTIRYGWVVSLLFLSSISWSDAIDPYITALIQTGESVPEGLSLDYRQVVLLLSIANGEGPFPPDISGEQRDRFQQATRAFLNANSRNSMIFQVLTDCLTLCRRDNFLIEAIYRLHGSANHESAWRPLLAVARNPQASYRAREAAIQRLIEAVSNHEVRQGLREIVETAQDPLLRGEAFSVLSQIGETTGISPQALTEIMLGSYTVEEVSGVAQLLEGHSSDATVRRNFMENWNNQGGFIEQAPYRARARILAHAARNDQSFRRQLIGDLQSDVALYRNRALWILSELADHPEVQPVLLAVLRRTPAQEILEASRRAALEAREVRFGALELRRAQEATLGIEEVRDRAIRSLERAPSPRMVQLLAGSIHDPVVRDALIQSLNRARQVFLATGREPRHLLDLVSALRAAVQEPGVAQALIPLALSRSMHRRQIIWALAGQNGLLGEDRTRFIRLLIHYHQRRRSLYGLDLVMDSAEARSFVINQMIDPTRPTSTYVWDIAREMAKYLPSDEVALSRLLGATRSSNPMIRENAATLLAPLIGENPRVRAALIPLLSDRSVGVARVAVQALDGASERRNAAVERGMRIFFRNHVVPRGREVAASEMGMVAARYLVPASVNDPVLRSQLERVLGPLSYAHQILDRVETGQLRPPVDEAWEEWTLHLLGRSRSEYLIQHILRANQRAAEDGVRFSDTYRRFLLERIVPVSVPGSDHYDHRYIGATLGIAGESLTATSPSPELLDSYRSRYLNGLSPELRARANEADRAVFGSDAPLRGLVSALAVEEIRAYIVLRTVRHYSGPEYLRRCNLLRISRERIRTMEWN